MSEDWVPALSDGELVRLAWQHGTSRPAVAHGPDRCDSCAAPYPCLTLRLAVELLESRGLDPRRIPHPTTPEHGTRSSYEQGCRCSACVGATFR